MTDLTDRLIALRDYLRDTPAGRPSEADLSALAEAADRLDAALSDPQEGSE